MGTLRKILHGLDVIEVKGSLDRYIGNICFDSSKAAADDVFVAVKGTRVDGHIFIPKVIEKGIRAVICEDFPEVINGECCYVRVPDSQYALGVLCSTYYDRPSDRISVIGVTGTNGKTTIATLLYRLFTELGYRCGLISTIHNIIAGEVRPARYTTPDALLINRLLSEMADQECRFAFMEVSSHAIQQKRIAGLRFRGGIFTNLTHDHLDYHKDFASYRDAKKAFFDGLPEDAFALVNADDRNGKIMIQNTRASSYTYGIKSMADFRAKLIGCQITGNHLMINNKEMWSRLPGAFNAYNVLAIYAAACLLGEDENKVLEKLSVQQPVEGRFQVIGSGSGPTAIVDYAHTPDAVENVLKTIRQISSAESRIITVIGAGGNRDKTKRPEMARIAAELSDKVILTSDNPRTEDPETIIMDMKAGLDRELEKKVISITDRKEAIRTACTLGQKPDIILVAGKGHETYQEIRGTRHHFDDREILIEFLPEV
jgi:UDP-N-acetylmuramoyl-L-alanyl-D-glutamate--2,6-diaminopimelate ligase